MLTSDLVDVAAKAAFDKLALNPVLVNVADRLAIAESFLIASASSERQVRAIGEEILDRVADELGVEPDHIEGRTGNRWILLDYGELVVHVLLDEERDFYRLENLWSDGVIVPLEDPALSDPVRERLGA
ncbi:MAG: ribosome silencing factor [Schaalia hyovaginalis]|uniref:ribosome silencing factor n=1 Tax=Schaalia hyovaginalis TaxID=29316 RepID=UPI0026EF6F77|nr:ribosome silencing factor [Schaalia hyovaginalis]MCI6411257.1 ribosome silencing factor [Schaalia hyovaginalis]MCI7512196.1 ribosome silencing factor [Schaalia hyovaginalis]MDY3664942.1 ribosome silencing factor [Schaalia hyovaginalis]MDY4261775.1 ribosome silencing factor [Schaalia hyovaginalis]MDY5600783.1 ribosome silencing factor [Schaalia hyovaginalis]